MKCVDFDNVDHPKDFGDNFEVARNTEMNKLAQMGELEEYMEEEIQIIEASQRSKTVMQKKQDNL